MDHATATALVSSLLSLDAALDTIERMEFRAGIAAKNCGTGGGGFQPGNHCGGRRNSGAGAHRRGRGFAGSGAGASERRARRRRAGRHKRQMAKHQQQHGGSPEHASLIKEHARDRVQLARESRQERSSLVKEHAKERKAEARDIRKSRAETSRDQKRERHEMGRDQKREAARLDRGHERERAKLEGKHARERERSTAAGKDPGRHAARHAEEHADLAAEHAEARASLATDHREQRQSLVEGHRDQWTYERGNHVAGIHDLRDRHRQEHVELRQGHREAAEDLRANHRETIADAHRERRESEGKSAPVPVRKALLVDHFRTRALLKNCGTGSGGFQAGNHCGGHGGGRRARGHDRAKRRKRKLQGATHYAARELHKHERREHAAGLKTERGELRRSQIKDRKRLAREHERQDQAQLGKPAHGVDAVLAAARERAKLRETHAAEKRSLKDTHREQRAKLRGEHRTRTEALHGRHRKEEADAIRQDRGKPGGAKPAPAEHGDASTASPAHAIPDPHGDHMEAWGQRHYGEWARGISGAEKEALASYTKGGYRALNTALRTGTVAKLGKTQAARLKALDTALHRAKTPEEIIVYRGISDNHRGGMNHITGLKPGDTIHDKGFASTSLSAMVSEGFASGGGATLRIRAPKGTPGAYVNALPGSNPYSHEREFLLPSGVGKFQVTKIEHTVNGKVIHVDLIP